MNDWMRCLCGHGTDIKPNEPFIFISGATIYHEIEGSSVKNSELVKLYACPKCGTVKMVREPRG